MSIRNRWIAFVQDMASRMEVLDPKGAYLFKKINEENIPPNEEMLEWGMVYVKAQQAMLDLVQVYQSQNKHEAALLVSETMMKLNDSLDTIANSVRVPREFVKEVKF